MNATQVKYARQRADTILADKLAALRKSSSIPELLTPKKITAALRAGRFSVVTTPTKSGYSIRDYVKFDDEASIDQAKAALREREAALRAAHGKLTDALVLGDASEALVLLSQFEAN